MWILNIIIISIFSISNLSILLLSINYFSTIIIIIIIILAYWYHSLRLVQSYLRPINIRLFLFQGHYIWLSLLYVFILYIRSLIYWWLINLIHILLQIFIMNILYLLLICNLFYSSNSSGCSSLYYFFFLIIASTTAISKATTYI